jgi:diguanylate cyclase (GGDEF)-like protein/PAS domain S-box-containing protein
MNELFLDFLTILLPTYFFFYMAVTLLHRNKNSMPNRIAALLMSAFFLYFLGEYVKTSLLPQYQMQIVLYGNAPMLLFVICFLVHLCILMGGPAASALQRALPVVYVAPFALWLAFLSSRDHRVLYDATITDGRSPLDPMFLGFTLAFVAGYIFLSVLILAVSWLRTSETKPRNILRALLLNMLGLFVWFVLVTLALPSIGQRRAMILYFVGYLVWGIVLRRSIGKHDIMPDYRKLFHSLFESAPTAILLLNREGQIRETNPRAAQWLEGIPAGQLTNHVRMKDGSSILEWLASLRTGEREAGQWELRLLHPIQGESDWVMAVDRIEGANEELFVAHLTDVTSLKDTERRLLESERGYKHLALHDSLTSLWNRAAIQEHVSRRIAGRERFALVVLDLDRFKPINDTYGHYAGDEYLKWIAERLRAVASPGEAVGRIGGDEFVLVASADGADDGDTASWLERRLSPVSEIPFSHEGVEIPVSFSAGVSVYPRDASDWTSLLKRADEAMYRVKRAGREGSS